MPCKFMRCINLHLESYLFNPSVNTPRGSGLPPETVTEAWLACRSELCHDMQTLTCTVLRRSLRTPRQEPPSVSWNVDRLSLVSSLAPCQSPVSSLSESLSIVSLPRMSLCGRFGKSALFSTSFVFVTSFVFRIFVFWGGRSSWNVKS